MPTYPEEHELQQIAEWPISTRADWNHWMAYIKNLWAYEDYHWRDEDGVWHLSTAGWSGNEDIIAAMRRNRLAWTISWQSSRRGGHYTFNPDTVRFPDD